VEVVAQCRLEAGRRDREEGAPRLGEEDLDQRDDGDERRPAEDPRPVAVGAGALQPRRPGRRDDPHPRARDDRRDDDDHPLGAVGPYVAPHPPQGARRRMYPHGHGASVVPAATPLPGSFGRSLRAWQRGTTTVTATTTAMRRSERG